MAFKSGRNSNSIARKTLFKVGIRIAIVILIASTIGYFHMLSNLRDQALEQLEKYVVERGQRESAVFALAEGNHALMKRSILSRLEALGDSDPIREFDALFERHEDGVIRNRTNGYDGASMPGVYIDDGLKITPDIRRRVLTFYNLCREWGPAWHNQFQDLYITTPDNIMVIYWPEIPSWCQDASPALYMPSEEYVWVADEAHNPNRETVWTGLFYDHVAKVWMVSCETPVYQRDRHIATIGHDITLNELVDRTLNVHLEGAFNVIARDDGRLIVHPDRMKEIMDRGGYYDINESNDNHLKYQLQCVKERKPDQVITECASTGEYIAGTRIEGPDWQFLTIFPKEIITDRAISTARFILLIGLCSLLLEVGILYLILRKQVALPLEHFVCAADRVASGDLEVNLDETRQDELGRLAKSFNSMRAAIHNKIGRLERTIDDHVKDEAVITQENRLLEETVRKRTKALEAAVKEAEASNRAKSTFLANMSHEIRTPMTAVLGYTELLRANSLDEDARKQAIHSIRRSGEHLLDLINDILDLSKIEARKLTVETVCFSPIVMLAEVHSILHPRALEQNITFSTSAHGWIPETITSDPVRFRQILINVIGNAIKFTERGKVDIKVRLIGQDTRDPRLEIEVTDTGIGMSEDQIQKIFSPFHQADARTTRKYAGTGLGLAISKHLARVLGGDIVAQSVPGEGSTFTITVGCGPLDDIVLLENPVIPITVAQRMDEDPFGFGEEKPLAGCRVLLAEDVPENQDILSFMLSESGCRVDVVENGEVALQQTLAAATKDEPYDIVLMDMQMPVMDGYEATTRLRDRGYEGTIIAMTAHAMEGDRDKCLAAGCSDFASKPVNRCKLVETMRRFFTPQDAPV